MGIQVTNCEVQNLMMRHFGQKILKVSALSLMMSPVFKEMKERNDDPVNDKSA